MTVAADPLPMEIITLVVEGRSIFKTKTQIRIHHQIYHFLTKKYDPSVGLAWLAQAAP